MPQSLLFYLHMALVTPERLTGTDLRLLQREYPILFQPQRCPHCHARLFDGWLFGQVKCWRCAEIFVGYLDRFVEALAQTTLDKNAVSPQNCMHK